MEPVHVAVIGTGAGDRGSAVLQPAPLTSGILETPGAQPNVFLEVVRPGFAIFIRFVHTFLVSFVGLITTAGIGVAAADAGSAVASIPLEVVLKTASWSSLIIAGVETLKNLVTIFGKLENKYPLWTGNI